MGSGIGYDPELSDVTNEAYISNAITVTTTQSEAKAGANRLIGREVLTIHNNGNATIYYGPTGVTAITGTPLYKDQFVSLPVGDKIGVFLITLSGTANVRIQEFA